MSELFGMSLPSFSGVGSSMVDFVFYMFIAAVVAGIIWGCLYLLSFKHLVRVRQHTASGYVIIDTKAREYATRDGARRWRFLKWIKQSYSAPPVDHLELTRRGGFSVEADRTLDGVITWRKRSGVADASDSFTSEERTMTAIEMRRSEEYKRTGLGQKLLEMAPIFLCVIIVVLLIAFWGDFVNTTTNGLQPVMEKQTKALETLDNTLSRLECLPNGNFTVKVDNKGSDLPVPSNLPGGKVPN